MGSDKERPLRGAVLCCTSIEPEKRSAIDTIARQIGADHKLDLTSDVTHLLVGDSNTPKYKYVARERPDVKVLRPEWVDAVNELWMTGDEVKEEDLKRLEWEYRWEAFAGLKISVTGWTDLHLRSEIADSVRNSGGSYSGDLTREITHLVARTAEGKKFQYAMQWGIAVVSKKWLDQSVERGMVLDETLYHPTIPEVEQGVGAFKKRASPPPLLGKRAREGAEMPPAAAMVRKLRRTASQKLGNQNDNLWNDIVGAGGTTSQDESSRRTSSGNLSGKTVVQEPQSFSADGVAESATVSVPEKPKGLLHGMRFFMHGFTAKEQPILQNHLLSNDAEVAECTFEEFTADDATSALTPFVIVPAQLPRSKLPQMESLASPLQILTHMWLEKCLFRKTVVPPAESPACTPFPHFPLPDFEDLTIASTGFSGIDLLHMSKSVSLMGAKYSESFTPKASILLCKTKDPSREKLRHAFEWGVDTVTGEWLWDSIRQGKRLGTDKYRVQFPSHWQAAKLQQIEQARALKQSLESKNETVQRKGRANGKSSPLKEIPNRLSPEKGRAESPEDASEAIKAMMGTRKPLPKPITVVSKSNMDENIPSKTYLVKKSKAGKKESGTVSEDMIEEIVTEPTEANENPPPTEDTGANTEPNPITSAINSFIQKHKEKQKDTSSATATNRSSSDPAIIRDQDGRRTNRRRDMLGRSSSNNSSKGVLGAISAAAATGVSRASSVDTMNDEGLGSIIETESVGSVSLRRGSTLSRVGSAVLDYTSRSQQQDSNTLALPTKPKIDLDSYYSVASMMEDGQDGLLSRTASGLGQMEEEQEPVLTQLGYEDPDSVRLREKMMRLRGGAGANATTATMTEESGEGLLVDADGEGRRRRKGR